MAKKSGPISAFIHTTLKAITVEQSNRVTIYFVSNNILMYF